MAKFRIRLVYHPGSDNCEILSRIGALEKRIFPHDIPTETPDRLYWWLVFHKDEVVGYAALDCRGGTRGFLAKCGVLPRWRGYGIQKRLIQARERYARRLGLLRVTTYARHDNFASLNSLARLSYKMYRPKDYNNHWVYWRKDFD